MQRQGGGACIRAGGEYVEGSCAPVRGGGNVPDGCVSGQCGLNVMSGGDCGCGTGINPKIFGGGRRNRRTRSRRQTRRNRRCWSRKNTRRRR